MSLDAEVRLQLGDFGLEVSLRLDQSTVLVGPNGGGKTSLLDCLAGLRRPDQGRISLDGQMLFAQGVDLTPARRRIGYVFQDGLLFPHLTVADNVGYPLAVTKRRAPGRLAELLEQFDLTDLAGRRPAALSAGERQRAAIARALAAEPRWLLLDEPFANLDPAARPALRRLLLDRLAAAHIPALLVTHDPEEALGLGFPVLVMANGRIAEMGLPEELLARPSSSFAAALAGVNHYVGRVESSREGLVGVRVGEALIWAAGSATPGARVAITLAPAEVLLSRERPLTSARNVIAGRIAALSPTVGGHRVELDGPLRLTAFISEPARQELGLQVGQPAVAFFKVTAARLS